MPERDLPCVLIPAKEFQANFEEAQKGKWSKLIEKKMKLSYFSWTVIELWLTPTYPTYKLRFRRDAGFIRTEDKGSLRGVVVSTAIGYQEGNPFFLKSGVGGWLECELIDVVTGKPVGSPEPDFYPIFDKRFGAEMAPDSARINYNMMRAGVKTIARRTGFGLHLYVGEDLVDLDNGASQTNKRVKNLDIPDVPLATPKTLNDLLGTFVSFCVEAWECDPVASAENIAYALKKTLKTSVYRKSTGVVVIPNLSEVDAQAWVKRLTDKDTRAVLLEEFRKKGEPEASEDEDELPF